MTTKVTASVSSGTFGARKNAIINGDFNVWQRGTSFAAIAASTYTADRWVYEKSGAMVHTVSRSTDVPTVAQAGRLFNYSILADCTTVDASIAAGDYAAIVQKMEGYNFLPLAQRTMTLSFWVKATKTGTYCVGFMNSVPDRSYVGEYTVSASDTWEYKTITVTASPSAGTWNYTTGIGVYVWFSLATGSTFQTTAATWATGNYLGTSNQVNACDSTSNNFYITGVQLEAGSTATDFEYRTYQDELNLCLRYFESWGGTHATETFFQGQAVSAVNSVVGAHYITKRIAPTLGYSAVGDFQALDGAFSGIAVTGLSMTHNGLKSGSITVTVAAGLTAGQGSSLLANSTTNARLTFSAEL
jgi:hypothetical protein